MAIEETNLSAEVARYSATGTVTVYWAVEKQMNDIWRAFDKISSIVFETWKANRAAAEAAVRTAAREKIGKGERYYPSIAGKIAFKDDGTFTI